MKEAYICNGCEKRCIAVLTNPAVPLKCLLYESRIAKWRVL